MCLGLKRKEKKKKQPWKLLAFWRTRRGDSDTILRVPPSSVSMYINNMQIIIMQRNWKFIYFATFTFLAWRLQFREHSSIPSYEITRGKMHGFTQDNTQLCIYGMCPLIWLPCPETLVSALFLCFLEVRWKMSEQSALL